MRCSIRNIDLPEPPRPATLPIRDNRFIGAGSEIHERKEPDPPLNLTPPEPSNSMRAIAERRQKVVLDLAREGKTLQEIAKETRFSKQYIKSIVLKYQEFGAKLNTAPAKKVRKQPPAVKKSGQCRTWKAEHAERTRALRKQGMTYKQIADTINVPQATIWNHREEFE